MEMKDIALMLCNLPDGNYKVKTKIGNVEVGSVWLRDRTNFRIITILINGKIYDQITYSDFNCFRLYEKISFENGGKPYTLRNVLLDLPSNTINYENDIGNEYEISSTAITNKSDHNITYNIIDGFCISENEDIKFIYNLETSEKLLYIKKFDCTKNNPTLENDYICINKEYDYEDIVWHYNNIIKSYQEKVKKHTSPIQELMSCVPFPIIDIKEVRKLDKEIDEYVSIYREFAPKLNKYHSKEMLKVLEYIATTLNDKYNKPKEVAEQKTKSKKLFDISKFKNK